MDRSRAIFEGSLARYAGKPGVVISQGFLRLESAILGVQNSIGFAVLKNEMAPNATQVNDTELRLDLTDNFIVTEMGLFIVKTAISGKLGGVELNTFVNSVLFPGAEATGMEQIYNANVNLQVNGETIIDKWDTFRHKRVGQAQKGVAGAVSNQWDNASYGFYPVTPQFSLNGNAKNQLVINLPESAVMTGAPGTFNYAVLVVRGLKIQNGSNIA